MIVCSVVLCVCCQSVLLVVLVVGLSRVVVSRCFLVLCVFVGYGDVLEVFCVYF